MRTRRTVSVAMAVYNGETYLKEQMDSILSQLGVKDEVILSLDPSTDRTLDIIKDYCLRDSRVHMCWGPGRGVIKNFENAIKHCRNEIIFLADQDDVWKSEKVEKVLMAFKIRKLWLFCMTQRLSMKNSIFYSLHFLILSNADRG